MTIKPIKILVADSSASVRTLLSQALTSRPITEVVGTATNGRIALEKIVSLNPNVVVLDIEMPEMNGLETILEIRKKFFRLPIIVFSTLTKKGAKTTLEALALGANDYATKPKNEEDINTRYVRHILLPKIKLFCQPQITAKRAAIRMDQVQRGNATETYPKIAEEHFAKNKIATKKQPDENKITTKTKDTEKLSKNNSGIDPLVKKAPKPSSKIEILAIAASTGGPRELDILFSKLPRKFSVPIVIVQHMPPKFPQFLAERLTRLSSIKVAEGQQGALLKPGYAWLAPGDKHMLVNENGIEIHRGPKENSCRPAADVLFRSLVKVYQGNILAVVLTGMGQDGLKGAIEISQAGGQIIVQDEASSCVWGMPGAIAKAGLAEKILPTEKLADEIIFRVHRSHANMALT